MEGKKVGKKLSFGGVASRLAAGGSRGVYVAP